MRGVIDTHTIEADVGRSLSESIEDYPLSLYTAGKAKKTQAVYTLAVTYFRRFLESMGMPRHPGPHRETLWQ